jgi:hypothetical protein
MRRLLTGLAALLVALPAWADIEVRFVEGAPKDRFVFTNTGGCATGPLTLTLDLAGSAAGLIFDVTQAGAGVQVYQPFEVVTGGTLLTAAPQVRDGDTRLVLSLSDLPVGQRLEFTIDVDDTAGSRATLVSDAEMARAGVQAQLADGTRDATFDATSRARLSTPACIS